MNLFKFNIPCFPCRRAFAAVFRGVQAREKGFYGFYCRIKSFFELNFTFFY